MSTEKNKIWIQTFFKQIFEDPDVDFKKIILEKVSPDYIQIVDGKTLDFDHFFQHIIALKEVISKAEVKFEHIVAEEDKVFTIHKVHVKKKNNDEIIAKVIAMFQIKNNKLILCDELTHIEKGKEEDTDLGSMT